MPSRFPFFCLFALGMVWPTGPGRAEAPEGLEIMSFNIRYGAAGDGLNHWRFRKAAVMEVIREHRPDILGLQEALRFQLDAIGEAFPGYRELGVGRDDGKTRGEYAALLIATNRLRVVAHGTFWFSDTPAVPGSISWGNRIPRICTWAEVEERGNQRRWRIYNLHLDHRSHPSRRKSVAAAALHAGQEAASGPVVIMGDFNMPVGDAAIRALLAPPEGYVDVLAASEAARGQIGTYHRWNGRPTGPRIDHILYRGPEAAFEAEVLNRTYLDRWPSDHFPVRARVMPAP